MFSTLESVAWSLASPRSGALTMKTTERSTPVSAAMRKRADRSSKLSLAVLDDVPDSPQRSADPVRRSHLWFIAIVECAGPLYRLFLRPIFTPLESVSPAHLAVENEEDMEWLVMGMVV